MDAFGVDGFAVRVKIRLFSGVMDSKAALSAWQCRLVRKSN
jgi:hypothetical protein